jgi:hypothetical protein
MSKIYYNHTTEVALDFGVIGDQYVDVIYDWHEPNPSNDPYQVPERGGVVVKDVLLFIDGKESSVMHWLSPSRIDEISQTIRERWE